MHKLHFIFLQKLLNLNDILFFEPCQYVLQYGSICMRWWTDSPKYD